MLDTALIVGLGKIALFRPECFDPIPCPFFACWRQHQDHSKPNDQISHEEKDQLFDWDDARH